MIHIMSSTREEPLFRKCCYCIPLRFCLQTWAYLKMVADGLAMCYVTLVIAFCYGFGHHKEISLIHAIWLIMIALIVDVGFLVTLVVGIFKKSYKILRVFYYYEFYMLTVDFVIMTIVCVFALQVDIGMGALYSLIGILYIVLDVCITMTVNSEMIKLRNKEQYEFTRMPDTRKDGAAAAEKCRAEQECINV